MPLWHNLYQSSLAQELCAHKRGQFAYPDTRQQCMGEPSVIVLPTPWWTRVGLRSASHKVRLGVSEPALRRAARYGDGFTQPGASREVYDAYIGELKKQNRPADNIRFASGFWSFLVSNDPDKTFAEAADHMIYRSTTTTPGYRRRGPSHFQRTCAIANICVKAVYFKSSIRAQR